MPMSSFIPGATVSISYKRAPQAIQKKNPFCPLCRYEYENKDKVHILACEHLFHRHCLNPHLKENRDHFTEGLTCPIADCQRLSKFNWENLRKTRKGANELKTPFQNKEDLNEYNLTFSTEESELIDLDERDGRKKLCIKTSIITSICLAATGLAIGIAKSH